MFLMKRVGNIYPANFRQNIEKFEGNKFPFV